ncbi:hypothetical protein N7488_004875 [Penicillium malachiteum]|nr:hypothetical protein N7488_004875 [Penicillium malachiteum]
MAEYQALTYVVASSPSLNSLYDRLMAKIDSRKGDSAYCRSVLEACCFAYCPLSYDELHVLANLPTEVPSRIIVQKCGSFLTVNNNVVRLIHNSAREYLEAYLSPDGQDSLINTHHVKMFDQSIAAMSKILKRNIWDISHDTERWETEAPEADLLASIRYSCEFWVDHLSQSQTNVCDDYAAFAFLQIHLLHWLESLSLVRKLSIVLPSIRTLLFRAKSKDLIILLNDAERFIRNNIQVMEKLPLQLYGTCLAFSPSKSEMRL